MDWSKVSEEMEKIKLQPSEESETPASAEVAVPVPQWYQFADWFTNQDELLKAILEQLKSMTATLSQAPAPPVEEPATIFPVGIEPKLDVIAAEQQRTKELLEGFNFVTGQATVQAAGSPIELISTVRTYLIVIRANIANTGSVYLGGPGVSAATGYILDAGEAIAIQVDNLKKSVWMDVGVSGEGVSWMALVD